MAKSKTSREIVAEMQKGQTSGGNPFSKAAKNLTARERAKMTIMSMDPDERKKLEKAQGKWGTAVADSVRGSHKIWRKGRSGDKTRGTDKRYI